MARVFLTDETYNAASDDAEINGSAGTEQVNVFAGVTGLDVTSSVERVDLPGDIADFTFSSFGNSVTIVDGDGNTVAQISGADGKQLVFGDGSVDVAFDAGTGDLTLGGETVTDDADNPAAITPAAGEIDDTTTSETADGTGGGDGETFTLTTGDDAPALTTGDDTVNGDSGTLNNGDAIVDQGGTGDVLNATIASDNLAPTVIGMESVNLTLDVFDGADATFDADDVSGATITGSSSKLGFNGIFEVINAGANTVTAGTNVTDLDVSGVTTGTVAAGEADTVVVAVTADTTEETIAFDADGDVDLTADFSTTSASENLNISAAGASVVTLNGASTIAPANLTLTGPGNGNLTLDVGDGADVTGATVSDVGTVDVSAAGTVDVTEFSNIGAIEVSFDGAVADIDGAQGQTVNITSADAQATVTGDASAGSTATVNVSADQSAGAATLTVDGVETSTINLSSDVETVTELIVEGDSTVNVNGDVTITTLESINATDTVTFAGSGSVTVTNAVAGLGLESVDASGLTGGLTLEQGVDQDVDIVGGEGANDIETIVTGNSAAITTGAGGDAIEASGLVAGTVSVDTGAGADTLTVSSTAVAGGTVAANMGDGDDTVSFADNSANAASTYALDFGDGDDTFEVADTEDLSDDSLNVVGLENIQIGAQGGGATGATFSAEQVSGQSFNILGGGDSTLTVDGTGDADTIDLSTLSFDQNVNSAVTSTTVLDSGGDDTVVASSIADSIDFATGANTADFTANASTEVQTDSISFFTTADDSLNFGIEGTATNFDESGIAGIADASAAITQAETVFDGTIQLAYIFDTGGTDDGFVVVDSDGDQTADQVVEMVGLTATGDVDFGDFIA